MSPDYYKNFDYIGFYYINNKTGEFYKVINYVINATNSNDGQTMVLYEKVHHSESLYVREIREFREKFTLISDNDFQEMMNNLKK